jgi:exodeoxyribonuclease X
MSCATLIDCETTGFDEPDVIELAWMGPIHAFTPPDQAIECRRFKPRKPITLGALAVHHILDEELAEEREWPGSWMPPGEYLIGHNVDFDWQAIGSPSLKRICTLALARRLWPDIDSHSLGALTYHFTPREEARVLLQDAHGAATDVDLCCRVLCQILKAMPLVQSWERLWDASERARVPLRMSFGKYGPHEAWAKTTGEKGMLCKEVKNYDPGYWEWLMRKCDQVQEDPYLRKALL